MQKKSTHHPRALVNQERYALVFGRVFWGRCVPGRANHVAKNLNVMKKAALHLLRKTIVLEKRFGVCGKMFRAAFSDDFLYHAPFG
ncbi:MAG: hypothetical protein LBB22_05735 [Treponema sp.]|jgi:hypothetical protein|nr:hypothetical protein [Treponema sp.]